VTLPLRDGTHRVTVLFGGPDRKASNTSAPLTEEREDDT
jgi:hypothetical protein